MSNISYLSHLYYSFPHGNKPLNTCKYKWFDYYNIEGVELRRDARQVTRH